MESITEMNWDELKEKYNQNLEMLKNAKELAQQSALDLHEIYSQVMEKSKNTSPEDMKKFTDLWRQKMNTESNKSISKVNEKYGGFLTNSQSEREINNLEQELLIELKDESLVLLSAYYIVMKGFYESWIEMWGK